MKPIASLSLFSLVWLGVPLATAQPAKGGWASQALGKQTAPEVAILSRDGKYLAEIVADRKAKVPKSPYIGFILPPDAVVVKDAAGKVLATVRNTTPRLTTCRIAFSGNGGLLAIGSIDGIVHVLDVQQFPGAVRSSRIGGT